MTEDKCIHFYVRLYYSIFQSNKIEFNFLKSNLLIENIE